MNDRFRNTLNLIEYISKPMNKSDVLLLYRVNNIIPERIELYLDFTTSLLTLVSNTYLGDDVIKTGEEQLNHFNWCWQKVLKDYQKEKIDFSTNNELYTYFKVLFSETFYEEEDKSQEVIDNTLKFWRETISYQPIKTRVELETFLEVYKIFDKSLN